MANALMTIEADTVAVLRLLELIPPTAQPRLKAVCKVSAHNVEREARSRIRVRSGATRAGISVHEDHVGEGYVVTTDDVNVDAGQLVRSPSGKGKIQSSFKQEKHVGLWLEKGTSGPHAMRAFPFFDEAGRLEEGPHLRRLRDELEGVVEGLGA